MPSKSENSRAAIVAARITPHVRRWLEHNAATREISMSVAIEEMIKRAMAEAKA
jgi:hypothetical protein